MSATTTRMSNVTQDASLDISIQNFTLHEILAQELYIPDPETNTTSNYPGESTIHDQYGTVCTENSACTQAFNFTAAMFSTSVSPLHPEIIDKASNVLFKGSLKAENDHFAKLNIPAMVFIGVLMIFGIVGNLLVVYVYGFRLNPTTQHFLIVCLAGLDLLMSCIAMPTDIADLRFHHTFSSLAACKLLRFITMFSSTSSSFTLVTIAWDRHKRVTRPLTRQMTLRDARVFECVNLGAALFFSWPLLVMTGLRTSETRVPGLFGTDCSFSDKFHDTRWPLLYNSVLGIGFMTIVLTLGILYFRIWKRVKVHRVSMARKKERGPESRTRTFDDLEEKVAQLPCVLLSTCEKDKNRDCSVNFNEAEYHPRKKPVPIFKSNDKDALKRERDNPMDCTLPQNLAVIPKTFDIHKDTVNTSGANYSFSRPSGLEQLDNNITAASPSGQSSHSRTGQNQENVNNYTERSSAGQCQTVEFQKSRNDGEVSWREVKTHSTAFKNIEKTTVVAFTVSVVFVISFLPYLILMFVRAFIEDFDYKLEPRTLWLYNLFLRFYLLNSAINPLLYGWLNKRFRVESKRLFCRGYKKVPK